MKRHRTWIALLTLLGSLVASAVQAQAPEDRWTFTLTPYLWLPSVDGSRALRAACHGRRAQCGH